MRGDLNSVIGTSLESFFLNFKVGLSAQPHRLEASDLHGLAGVGHCLLTGQWHHWGFQENFDSSSLPSAMEQPCCSIVKEDPLLRKPACHLNSPKLGHTELC